MPKDKIERYLKPKPELLLPADERVLRLLLRALTRPYESADGAEGESRRVKNALAHIRNQPAARGPAGEDRDELLEMMAFQYSVERYWKQNENITWTEIARELIEAHPEFSKKAHRESIVRDLVRKFNAHACDLLKAHAYDGNEEFESLYMPVVVALEALQSAGVRVDWTALPPGARRLTESKGDYSAD